LERPEIARKQVARKPARVEFLLSHEHFVMQDSETVAAALETYRNKPSLGFPDCLIVEVARKAGHVPVGTFDRQLARLPQVECVL